MRLNARERAEALELIEAYLPELDDAGLYMVLETAHSMWKNARKGGAEANQEAAAECVRTSIAARRGDNIIPFPRR